MFYRNYSDNRRKATEMRHMLVVFELLLLYFLGSEFWTDPDLFLKYEAQTD